MRTLAQLSEAMRDVRERGTVSPRHLTASYIRGERRAKRQISLDAFDAFCWAQENRVHHTLQAVEERIDYARVGSRRDHMLRSHIDTETQFEGRR